MRVFRCKRHCLGFSFVELTVSMAFLGLISVFAYRAVSTQVKTQFDQSASLRVSAQAAKVVDRLRADIEGMDSNWRDYAVSPVSFNDGVLAMVLPDPNDSLLYKFGENVSSGNFTDSEVRMRNLGPGEDGPVPDAGQRVMIYKHGEYLLRSVEVVGSPTDPKWSCLGEGCDPISVTFSEIDADEIDVSAVVIQSPETLSSVFEANESVLQPVQVISYKVMPVGDESFLARSVNGGDYIPLSPAETFDVSFEEQDGVTVAARIEIETKIGNSVDRSFARLQLPGSTPESVEGTQVSTSSILSVDEGTKVHFGQPVMEYYDDGTGRIILPSVQFDTESGLPTYAGSSSYFRIYSVDGTHIDTVGPLTFQCALCMSAHPFILSTLHSLNGVEGPGLIGGGYYQNDSDVAVPVFMLVHRSSLTGKIDGSSTVTYQEIGGIPADTLGDTGNVAVVRRSGHLNEDTPLKSFVFLAASFPKITTAAGIPPPPQTIQTCVYRIEMTGENPVTFGGSQQFLEKDTGGRTITAMGPILLKTRHHMFNQTPNHEYMLAVSYSNTAAGLEDGAVHLHPVSSTGSLSRENAAPTVTHNGRLTGVSGDGAGNLVLSGQQAITTVSRDTLINLIAADDSVSREAFRIDDPLAGAYSRYYAQGPGESYIERTQGMAVSSVWGGATQVLMVVEGEEKTYLLLNGITLEGVSPRIIASIAPAMPLTDSLVSPAYRGGTWGEAEPSFPAPTTGYSTPDISYDKNICRPTSDTVWKCFVKRMRAL